MMDTNFACSRATFDFCTRNAISLVYASSAAVYGNGTRFEEAPQCERPLNVYGYSKLAFDQYVRRRLGDTDSLVAGLRYFNVYGPREQHKGSMASVAWHFNLQMRSQGTVRLFQASHGYGDGEQKRDFVYVDDAVDVTLWFGRQGPGKSGIFNCGTGRAETFNAVADAVIDWYARGAREYIEFPPELAAAYQAFTQADLSRLRAAGYEGKFRCVADGVREYLNWLNS
jgi:ADP-L-glycero-D-manno-heptose 6-epimerase